MDAPPTGSGVDGLAGSGGTLALLGTVDPTVLTELPGPWRGTVAFVVVLVLGAVLLQRRGAFVERSIDASLARPLSSLGYGVAAHAVIAFAGVYVANQLATVGGLGQNAAVVGALTGGLMLVTAGALGFTVVGSIVADLGGRSGEWSGPVLGAVIAGVAAAIEPVVGAVVWFVVVSTGIGGPVRKWVHASAGPDP